MRFSYVSQGTLAGAAVLVVLVLIDLFTTVPALLIYIVGPLALYMVPYFIYDKVLKVSGQKKGHFAVGIGLTYGMSAIIYFMSVMAWQNW